MDLLPTILRRAIITAILCAVFWFGVAPIRHGAKWTVLIIGAFLLAGLIVGVLLTWPRPIWARVLIFFALALLIGLRIPPLHPERPFAKLVTALTTVAPLAILLLLVVGVDWAVAKVLERRR